MLIDHLPDMQTLPTYIGELLCKKCMYLKDASVLQYMPLC